MRATDVARSLHSTSPSRPTSATGSEAELTDLTAVVSAGNTVESSLLPADHGKDAWLFLMSSFIVEALIWGEDLCSPCG